MGTRDFIDGSAPVMLPRDLWFVALIAAWTTVAYHATAAEEHIPFPAAFPPTQLDTPADASPPPAALTPESNGSVFQRLRSWSDERLRVLYENIIVDAQDRHSFGARPQPHFGDLIHGEYTRLDLRYFYGFADKLEGEATFRNYFPSPGKGAEGVGIAEIRIGSRYRWKPAVDPTGKAVTGFEISHPITGSPDNLTEGVNRYSVFCSYARTSTRIANFQEFLSLSYTVMTPAGARGLIAANLPQNDYLSVSVGWLRNVGRFTYGLTVGDEYVTDGPPANFLTITPTVMVSVPGRYVLRTPGEWQLGGSVACKRYHNLNEFEFRVRVRWYVQVSQVKEMLRGWSRRRR